MDTQIKNSNEHSFLRCAFILVTLTIGCLTLSPAPQAFGVVPAPDGGYPGFNTAEGQNALFSLTIGSGNSAVGAFSLFSNTEGNFNTGVGIGALLFNVGNQNTGEGTENTATGAAALLNNTTGFGNTANGAFALLNNTTGAGNTATGISALSSNVGGTDNTAVGTFSLLNNTGGNSNTAVGRDAMEANVTGNNNTALGRSALAGNGDANTALGFVALGSNVNGDGNTAVGSSALTSNRVGSANTAVGYNALLTAEGSQNTAVGYEALSNNTFGSYNAALGFGACYNVINAYNVTCIGYSVVGADVDSTTWIGNVYGVTTQSGTTAPVVVSDGGQLGTVASSERFKKDIATMETASEAILSLRPVTFHYKTDTKGIPQFGLIAEEVAKVNPALVLPDKEGKPYTVRYDAVNAMLLNEFLKEHKRVREQQARITELDSRLAKQDAVIAQQQKGMDVLSVQLKQQAAKIQKVTAQFAAASGAAGMRSDIDGPSREADVSGSEQVNPSRAGLEPGNPSLHLATVKTD